ncbi:hypothetical protein B0H13DRAFT_1881575 [Mycena leptocephala]|nr:hypothetical protein B0H13DRAFT_1881575 [Mycena leptocephala]
MRKHGSFFASLSLALIQRQPRRDVDAFVTYSYQLGLVFFCLSLLPIDLPLKIGAQVYRCTEFYLPSTTDTNDSEERRGVELRKRTVEYSSRIEPGWDVVHIARTNGMSSERRRKAALEGGEASRVRVWMQDLWSAHQRSPTRSGRDTE